MAFEFQSESFCAELSAPTPLEQVLRGRYPGASWSAIRKLVSTGKVALGGAPSTEGRQLVAPGSTIQIRMTAPKPRPGSQHGLEQLLYCDPQVVVVKKPAGISSVIHEDEPTSLQEQVRVWLSERERRPCPPLKVVHRLDKVTSGVMLFARTAAAQAALKEQFRAHTTGRYYTAVAHGRVEDATLSFRLVRNRGDGLRGITKDPNEGTHSVTHVTVRERLARCSVLECRLETGRTHQIRVHLSEQAGAPLLADALYGAPPADAGLRKVAEALGRQALHAGSLGFIHPITGKPVSFESPLPRDMSDALAALRSAV